MDGDVPSETLQPPCSHHWASHIVLQRIGGVMSAAEHTCPLTPPELPHAAVCDPPVEKRARHGGPECRWHQGAEDREILRDDAGVTARQARQSPPGQSLLQPGLCLETVALAELRVEPLVEPLRLAAMVCNHDQVLHTTTTTPTVLKE